MGRVDRLYEWLGQGPAPDCDDIFAAALPHAESPYFERIVEQLLRRGTETGWAGVVANYQRLAPEVRGRLAATNPSALRAGLAAALTASDAQARLNALMAMVDQPCPRLTYLLPDLLRDASDDVRKAALKALRRVAEVVADDTPAPEDDEPRRQERALARTEMAKALRKALNTFDRHYRVEVLQLSLWFVRDLGGELWEMLGNRRSQWANIAALHLHEWDSPRLARFLLEALAQPAWRMAAVQVLRAWSSPAQLTALLRSSDLLSDPEIRRPLGTLKRVNWFAELTGDLSCLPADVRALPPVWLACLGISSREKLDLLLGWLDAEQEPLAHARGSDRPAVQRACVEALGLLDIPGARARLEEIARGDSPLAAVARSRLTLDTPRPPQADRSQSDRAALPRAACQGQADQVPTAPPPPPETTPAPATAAAQTLDNAAHRQGQVAAPRPEAARGEEPPEPLTELRPVKGGPWAACQDHLLNEDDELIALLRASAADWRNQVLKQLRSADPRQRLLGLRMVATSQASREFRSELERMVGDPVAAIARVARVLLRAKRTGPAPVRTGGETQP